jgi:hypothetical protein
MAATASREPHTLNWGGFGRNGSSYLTLQRVFVTRLNHEF